MIRLTILMLGAGLLFFAITNAVWMSIDGKERPGARLISESPILEFMASIPNPFAPDPSKYLLAELQDVDGWTKTVISNPWTERPIQANGHIPTDAELPEIIRRHSSGVSPNFFGRSMGSQKIKDGHSKSDGALRTGANYSNGTAAFNVIVERMREPDYVDPRQFNALERAIYNNASAFMDLADKATPRITINGLDFTEGLRGTQTALRGTTHKLRAVRGNTIIRIWGTGRDADVEALVTALFPTSPLPLPGNRNWLRGYPSYTVATSPR